MIYLLDTNIFLKAKNVSYGFDFCPAFWDWLELENDKEKIFSIRKVAEELKGADDNVWK